ncbi:unnamed protein product, partial [Brassica rapa subsp. narinosa]
MERLYDECVNPTWHVETRPFFSYNGNVTLASVQACITCYFFFFFFVNRITCYFFFFVKYYLLLIYLFST